MKTQHNKGTIRDNALAALVHSDVFRPKQEKAKKGKGSFKRNNKHKNKDYSGKVVSL